MQETTLEQLQVAYGMVLNHLKESEKEENDSHVKLSILVLVELNKRIIQLTKNNPDKTKIA